MIQLNLGSGNIYTPLAGWMSMDRFGWPVNVSGDVTHLPFKNESVDHIMLSHVIEHVPVPDVGDVLTEIHRVMKPNGIFYCSGPDMERTEAIGSPEWIWFTKNGGSRPGWEHHWDCSVRTLRNMLLGFGFAPTWCKSIPPGWPPNTHAWPLDLEARFLCRKDDFPWPNSFPSNMLVQT